MSGHSSSEPLFGQLSEIENRLLKALERAGSDHPIGQVQSLFQSNRFGLYEFSDALPGILLLINADLGWALGHGHVAQVRSS